LYRFLERVGHMAGPVVVSYILLLNHQSAFSITWIGLAVISLGLLFTFKLGARTAPVHVGERRL
jgi:hypothetical protein